MLSLNNMKLRGKLGLIVAVLFVPIMILAYLFVSSNLKDIQFAEKERAGTAYLEGVWDVMSALTIANATDSAPAQHMNGAVDLAALGSHYDARLGTTSAADAFRTGLQGLNFPTAQLIDDAGPAAVIAKGRSLISAIDDSSNLTLDPDLDSFYVMDAAVVRSPEVADKIQRVTTLIHEQSQQTSLTDQDKGDLMIALSELDSVSKAADASLNSAFAGNKSGETRKALADASARNAQALLAFQQVATSESAQLRNHQPVNYLNVRAKAEAALNVHTSLTDLSLKELDRLLKARIDGLWASMWTLLAIAGVITAAALALTGYIALEISGTLGRMISVMAKLASDDFDVVISGADRRDEIGAMAKSVEVFKANGMESTRIAGENLRIKVALDNCSTNVMMADPDGRIVYLNTAIAGMFRTAEADLRTDLPNFDASRLDGASMDVFHKNPEHQKGMLQRLTGTYKAAIQVGGRHFNLIANPVIDGEGRRLGSVVEWADMTAERRIEAEIDRVVNEAVAGNFNERLQLDDKSGFMRNLAEAMNRLCENTAESLAEVSTHLGYLAEGDLTRRIEHSYSGLFEDLKNKLNDTCDQLSSIVEQVVDGAGEIKVATAEITAGTNDLSQRTEQQASSLEETASSMEEIASTIRQNADNAQEASKLASKASSVAGSGGQVVAQAVEAMSRIETSSQKISDIIGVIDEIAFQTNLLALNAAVEAARAGDAGKGFAVVAAEVRSLAQRSSGAAKDIKTLIAASGSEVKEGVKLVNDAGGALNEIVGSIRKVAEIVSEIAAASKEQSVGVEEINTAVAQMDEMTQQNSALVEENAASSRMLQDQAESMHQRMSFFRLSDAGLSDVPSKAVTHLPPPVAKPAAKRVAAPARKVASGGASRLQANLRSAIENGADWTEF